MTVFGYFGYGMTKMNMQINPCGSENEQYPTIKKSPFVWVPPHLEADGIRPKFPPRKPELRQPLLWLVAKRNKAWLVNCCNQALPEVVVRKGGFGGGDEPMAYSANEDWVYRDILPGFCVLVDEWDEFYDLDFYIFCYLKIDVPGCGEMSFCAGGARKGCIDSQILLWNNCDKGGLK